MKIKTQNNLDLIRLLAALQVAVFHMFFFLKVPTKFNDIIALFPGVPIFFFISGFLIYGSWNNIHKDKLKVFFTNRILRIYPALILCFFISVLSVIMTGYLKAAIITDPQFISWAAAQLSIFQFYNPEFLRGYGIGALNGSLWTIAVELQFYVLTPLIAWLYRYHKKWAVTFFMVCVVFNILNTHIIGDTTLMGKLFKVSFMPWISMFMVGAYVSSNARLQSWILKRNLVGLILIYVVTYYMTSVFGMGNGNGITLIAYLAVAALVFKLAYTKPQISDQLLKKMDISYGIYIYHMPVINFLIFYNYTGTAISVISGLSFTIILAIMSWVFIEKPALKFKKMTLRKE